MYRINKSDFSSRYQGLNQKSFFDLYEPQSKELGAGGFGKVYAGKRIADNQSVALKEMWKKMIEHWVQFEKEKIRMPLEIAILYKLNHHIGIIELLDWYDTGDSVIMIMETSRHFVDMLRYIRDQKTLKEEEARLIFKKIVSAVKYTFSQDIVHGDIKCDNILLDRNSKHVKLIDFGCATLLYNQHYARVSEIYIHSVEWLKQGCYKEEPATVWSLGCTLFRSVCCKNLPLDNGCKVDLATVRSLGFVLMDMVCGENSYRKNMLCDGSIRFEKPLSIDLQNLITTLLSKEPNSIPSLNEIMSHPWLQKVDD